ncbi:mitochondrial import translocase, subunit Tom22 [Basidiobolus meristosporus CBS 931.73]|uniref:Mitochondrial import translocase, subunit Tom22 n=1 Tax=Basidiobolus meristosporus CBS 931.73 TaxID=1314790 RepID=A0A1Y1Y9J7_9FUNG|nr:mitochondrial import translocase, subunit Tom22 [Basidiobolus meristosporus CBS 931.73]|eukprot:ORX94681.1 mitochondrial import translocase, subunit Tom22 [Basidiobolus meristosporus CBS 931.73]
MGKIEELPIDHVEEVSDSEYSDFESDSDYEDIVEESLLERLQALKEVIPEKQRKAISSFASSIYNAGWTATTFVGKSAWVLTTSALLIVLPLALEIEKEQALLQFENEARMQQQSQQQMLSGQPGQTLPGQMPYGGLVPPGFQPQ